MAAACPRCACASAEGARAHALLALLADDDLDAALELGLLAPVACPACSGGCNARLADARDARQAALDARERYRMRAQRLARRNAARDAARRAPASATSNIPALPPAAADALARALAKAGGRKPP